MKLLRTATIIANGLMLAGILGACQTENDITLLPQTQATAPDRSAKMAYVPQLIKDGNKVLEYSTNALGRKVLNKVIDQSSNSYQTFTYTTQAVTVKCYQTSNDAFINEFIYKLDANGKCYEAAAMNKVYGFEYNADGQLSKRFSKTEANERAEFIYTVFPGSNSKALHKILCYNKFNQKYREITYNYGATPDLSLINPDSFFDTSTMYLPIFGKFNTNLPSLIFDETGTSYNKTAQDWQLEYTFNTDGYVKTISRKIIGSNNPVVTERKYSTPIAQ